MSRKHGSDGFDENVNIQPDGPVAHIESVQGHSLLVGVLFLPETCQRPVTPGHTWR